MRKNQGPPASKSGYRKDDSRKPYGKKEDTRSNYGSKEGPRGRKDGDKPFRKSDDGGYKKEERSFGDRPKRNFSEEKGERRSFDKKPGRFNNEDRPKRSFDGDGEKKPYDRKPKKFEGADRPKRSFADNDGERKPFDRKPKRFDDGGERKPFGKKPGFKKKFDGDEKPARSFGKKEGGEFEKPARGKFSKDKFADRKAGLKKGGKKADSEDPSKFRNQDIFEKTRSRKKEEDENYILNENEGFSKEVEDKYGKKPRSKKQQVDDDFEDDEDDFIDPKSIKKNAARYEEVKVTAPMTLNKYIAHSGQCSRRDAAELVKKGKVRVNGELMLDPGYRVLPDDQVVLGGKKLTPQKHLVYILLNKPKGFITTTEDPEGRKTVMELVENAGVERLFPVGRLDRNTTGLLLLTNDGDLAQKLSHPSHEVKKIYQVTLDKALTKADFEKVLAGVELEDGVAKVDSLAYLENKNEVGLEIHSGRNRIVRRIFESLGYEVDKLDRVMYAGLTKKNISRGQWRILTDREVVLLKHFKN
jgi:23S rRNA pseudouridine2605 synthase